MELGWAAVIQALLIAASTWFVRLRAKQESADVIKLTASQGTTDDILKRVKTLETDLALVKQISLKTAAGIDHRAPRRT